MKKIKRLLIPVAFLFGLAMLSGCALWDSTVKSFESDTKGLDRVVTVLDEDGEVYKTYEGIIRVNDNDYGNKVVFELNGKRIGIYNMDVVIEER